MSDLIERLRRNANDGYTGCSSCEEAADEIERLRECVESNVRARNKYYTELERYRAENELLRVVEGEARHVWGVMNAYGKATRVNCKGLTEALTALSTQEPDDD